MTILIHIFKSPHSHARPCLANKNCENDQIFAKLAVFEKLLNTNHGGKHLKNPNLPSLPSALDNISGMHAFSLRLPHGVAHILTGPIQMRELDGRRIRGAPRKT